MSIFIRSLSLNPVRFRRCPSAEHVSSRLNSLPAIKLPPKPSLLSLRSDQRRCAAVHHAAQSLHLSPRLTIRAAGLSLKSP